MMRNIRILWFANIPCARTLATLIDSAPADKNGAYVCLRALIAIDSFGARAKPMAAAIKAINVNDPATPIRAGEYPGRIMRKLQAEL